MITWIKSLFTKPVTVPAAEESITKSAGGIGAAMRGVMGGSPGAWASDHRKEAEQYQGWNYVAIKAILKQCAGAECQVFEERSGPVEKMTKSHAREIPENFSELPSDHRLVKLMKRPNPNESGSTFISKIAMQIHLTGSAYIVKLRNMSKLPVELYVIPTGWVTPVMPSGQYKRGAYRVDDFRSSQGADGFAEMGNFFALAGAIIDPEDMIVIREPHPSEPCDGQSPVSAIALWSDTSKQVDQARWAHMKNGVNPSMVIVPDKENAPTEEEATRATAKINQGYAGSQNAGKVIVSFPGSTITPTGQTAEDMGYVTGADQLRNSILSAHGVPASAAGITDGGSYAAFYANMLQFITLTVQPLLNMIAEELARQLPEFGENLVIWLTAAAIDDKDMLERQLATDGVAKSITKNEQRALRGLPPHPDGDVWVGDPPPNPMGGMPGAMGGGMGGLPAPQLGETETKAPDEESTGLPGVPKLASLTKAGDGGCGTGAGGFKPGNECAGDSGGDSDAPSGDKKSPLDGQPEYVSFEDDEEPVSVKVGDKQIELKPHVSASIDDGHDDIAGDEAKSSEAKANAEAAAEKENKIRDRTNAKAVGDIKSEAKAQLKAEMAEVLDVDSAVDGIDDLPKKATSDVKRALKEMGGDLKDAMSDGIDEVSNDLKSSLKDGGDLSSLTDDIERLAKPTIDRSAFEDHCGRGSDAMKQLEDDIAEHFRQYDGDDSEMEDRDYEQSQARAIPIVDKIHANLEARFTAYESKRKPVSKSLSGSFARLRKASMSALVYP